MIDINSPEDLEKHVLNGGTVLLDFWAPWCGPCQSMMPTLDALAAANPDLTIAKVNVDENKPLAAHFGIRGIPALFLFKNGEVVQRLSGAQPLAPLQRLVDQVRGA